MERMMMRKKSKINAAAAANGSSGSKSMDDDGSRKPLSDLSNLNLIPTDILRKLCSNSISSSDAQSLLRKYQAPGIQIQGNSNSSKSDTSIGSSNFNTITKHNGRSTTRHLHHSTSASSVKDDVDCEPILHVENRNVMNLEKHGKVSSDNGKSVSIPSRTTRASTAKNKQKAVMLPSDFTQFGKAIDEDKPKVSPLSVKPILKRNDTVKEKGKEAIAPHDSGHYNKIKDKGKALAMPLSSLSEQTEDNGKSTPISWSLIKKQNKSFFEAVSSTPMHKLNPKSGASASSLKVDLSEKTKAAVVPFSADTYEKTKDKGKAIAMPPSSLSKHAKGTGISTEMLFDFTETNEQKESKAVVVSASSCPPVRRKRNTRDDLSQGGAWTDSHPKLKKKRWTEKETISENLLPEEFVKQQKAYFQQVDDFELEVEEA